MSDDAPIHECESEIVHYTGHYVPHSLRRVSGFFNVPQIYYMCKGLWDGAYGLSSLSEKTRKSNHLQMLLQRQHFLLSYSRPWVLVRPGFEPTASRSADRRSPNWANRAAFIFCQEFTYRFQWDSAYKKLKRIRVLKLQKEQKENYPCYHGLCDFSCAVSGFGHVLSRTRETLLYPGLWDFLKVLRISFPVPIASALSVTRFAAENIKNF